MDSEKRYQVFISSTYKDLREERHEVVMALLDLGAFPAGMELFPAADENAWSTIEEVIRDSDFYLLIIGGKYGSIDDEFDLSYTEREYDLAVGLGKPVMAFLHADVKKLIGEKLEETDEGKIRLDAFREKVQRAKHVKYWSTAAELGAMVARSWGPFSRRHEAVGWIRGDRVATGESVAELGKAQAEVARLTEALEAVRTQAPPGTEDLAQGSQTFRLPIFARGTYSYVGEYRNYSTGVWTDLDLTWDRTFGYLGLSMMHEATSQKLRDDLVELVSMEDGPALRAAFEEAVAAKAAKPNPESNYTGPWFHDEEFQTILLQLTALGLIQKSTKSRSVKDSETYWTLTPFGSTRLVQLRALRRGVTELFQADEKREPVETDAGEQEV